jgi:hypothetical protein
MDTIYNRKTDKVKPVNSDKLNSNIPERSKSWRENIIRKKMKNVELNLNDLYAKWLIPKFSKIVKNNRLIPERIEKLIVRSITPQKKKLLLAILHNREIILTWEFSKIKKIKSKVSFPIVIRTVPHKA